MHAESAETKNDERIRQPVATAVDVRRKLEPGTARIDSETPIAAFPALSAVTREEAAPVRTVGPAEMCVVTRTAGS